MYRRPGAARLDSRRACKYGAAANLIGRGNCVQLHHGLIPQLDPATLSLLCHAKERSAATTIQTARYNAKSYAAEGTVVVPQNLVGVCNRPMRADGMMAVSGRKQPIAAISKSACFWRMSCCCYPVPAHHSERSFRLSTSTFLIGCLGPILLQKSVVSPGEP